MGNPRNFYIIFAFSEFETGMIVLSLSRGSHFSLIFVMPEIRECIAHFIWILLFLNWCKENNIDLRLLGLWADAAKNERETLSPGGLVYRLSSSSKVLRGSCSAQTPLFPPMCQLRPNNHDPLVLEDLVWKDVIQSHTCRTVVLDLGGLYLQVCCHRIESPNCF